MDLRYTLQLARESDGRWMSEIRELPGVMAYAGTREAAVASAVALALRVVADRVQHGEIRGLPSLSFAMA